LAQLCLGIVDEERVPRLVERLIAMQWPDGGWNCDKRPGARTSSVQETLLPLRGLALWARLRKDAAAGQAARRAAEFLLERGPAISFIHLFGGRLRRDHIVSILPVSSP
jgi:hypothetical protein